jgi:hypothetical protein
VCSEDSSIALVFVTAMRMAQSSGKSEISVDLLLAALDKPAIPNEVQAIEQGFLPVPREDMPLSTEAQKAIEALWPIEKIFTIPASALRIALLATAGLEP